MEVAKEPRQTLLERRLKNEPPLNSASSDGSGAVLTVDLADLMVGELSTSVFLEDMFDTGLQRMLAIKVQTGEQQTETHKQKRGLEE